MIYTECEAREAFESGQEYGAHMPCTSCGEGPPDQDAYFAAHPGADEVAAVERVIAALRSCLYDDAKKLERSGIADHGYRAAAALLEDVSIAALVAAFKEEGA